MSLTKYLKTTTSSSILSVFRFSFGFLMSVSLIRFWIKGWIHEFYIDPVFHFTYHSFEWVKPIGEWTYLIFIICIISSISVCVGYKYRLSIILFFISFMYIELMDKTHYLNHYYFISVLSFLMIFLPANASFSVDNLISGKIYNNIPKWNIDAIKLLISIVYIYAAIAKVNSDWLLHAEPLKTWLSGKYDYYILGYFFSKNWVHYLFSWFGLFYDLTIPFLLFYRRTRLIAFVFVIVFHAMTKILFPIGMFPYIMIISATIFFSSAFHDSIRYSIIGIINKITHYISFDKYIKKQYVRINQYDYRFLKPTLFLITIFFVFQLLFPWRHLLYPGDILWHEQGYRYSWRVMLIEKTGFATFKVANSNNKNEFFVFDNHEKYLTSRQTKQMSFQPDFILEYAHFLGDMFSDEFNGNISIYCNSEVKLNHRCRQKLINDTVDLLKHKRSFKNKTWILPLNNENKSL